MKVTVAADEWRRRFLTVAEQHGGSRWLRHCFTHNGMEEEKNRIGAGNWVHITIKLF